MLINIYLFIHHTMAEYCTKPTISSVDVTRDIVEEMDNSSRWAVTRDKSDISSGPAGVPLLL